ncbi:MAG: hypothetical protein R2755_13390 [Acidimicrobiales bacterium]
MDLHTHYDAQIRWTRTARSRAGTASPRWCWATAASASPRSSPTSGSASMLTMVRTEAIPFQSMVEGMLPKWDWETIPEYLDSLERAPLGIICIQYMPTASLMIYVMGLEAAKTRRHPAGAQGDAAPAARGHGRRPVRLLHPAPRPELGAGRLRRHPDGDRHHVRRGHPRPRRGVGRARRGLHPAHPGHR